MYLSWFPTVYNCQNNLKDIFFLLQLNLEQSVFCQPRRCRKGHGSSNIRPPASLKAEQGAQRALPEESEFLKFRFISSLGYISIVGGRRDFCPVQSEADRGTPISNAADTFQTGGSAADMWPGSEPRDFCLHFIGWSKVPYLTERAGSALPQRAWNILWAAELKPHITDIFQPRLTLGGNFNWSVIAFLLETFPHYAEWKQSLVSKLLGMGKKLNRKAETWWRGLENCSGAPHKQFGRMPDGLVLIINFGPTWLKIWGKRKDERGVDSSKVEVWLPCRCSLLELSVLCTLHPSRLNSNMSYLCVLPPLTYALPRKDEGPVFVSSVRST